LKISRKDKISEVLRRVNHKRGILGAIKKRKHSWLGHTLHHDGFLGDISGRAINRSWVRIILGAKLRNNLG